MEPARFTQTEFVVYGAIAGAILGFILGLIILIVGLKKGKKKLGLIGLVCSTLVGPISGILSLIAAGIFIWLILKKPAAKTSSESEETVETVETDNL